MATLPTAIGIPPCDCDCRSVKTSKLKYADHYTCTSRITRSFEKMNVEKKLLCGEVASNVSKTSLRNVNMKVFATSRIFSEPILQRFSTSSEIEEQDKVLRYLFRTEIGGLVNVSVRKKNGSYAVYIEVLSLELSSSSERLVLSWAMYRADSLAVNDRIRTVESSFTKTSFDKFALELDFEVKQTPLYLSFLLKYELDAGSSGIQIKSHRKTRFCVPIGFGSGHPFPMGLSFSKDGSLNFSIFSRNTQGVVLCMYDDSVGGTPALELDLDPYVNRTGDIWHASFESASSFVSYGYRFKWKNRNKVVVGDVLLDPYAKIVANSVPNSHGPQVKYLGQLNKEPVFDWSGDMSPNLPMESLVMYRLNVRRFTENKSSQLPSDIAGTFSGLTEKLQHFKDLGVNAVLFEPIFTFDDQKGPYFPCHFFSPMNQYGPSGVPVSATQSMKEMVKILHANGIEVLLEVVVTHTAENGALKGIDDLSYYYKNGAVDLESKNALNCNYPIVQQMILDSLRYWVAEFHIDGFCFINASFLLRGFHGEYLSRPPLVEAISFDPILSKTKIIADFWDPHNKVVPKETQTHFPHWKRWAEINTRFHNDVRNFLRGEGLLSDLATRICGSGDIFSAGRGPAFSFNCFSRNSGLHLVDLVSFSSSSELASELSWNCGEEGPTNNANVLVIRLKQIRNFLFVLFVSLGVPILNMGDECGQSSGGSPAYNDRKSLDWNAMKANFTIQTTQFISFLSALRMRRSDLLQRKNFLKVEYIDWYGSDLSPPKWDDPTCKFIAVKLGAEEDNVGKKPISDSSYSSGDLLIACNADDHSECFILPQAPNGMIWHRLVDTALPFPGFFLTEGEPVFEQKVGVAAYEMKSHSCALFEARLLPSVSQTLFYHAT